MTRAQSDLSEMEREIDRLLQDQRAKATAGYENALDVTTLNVAAHRLQSLIHDRRPLLAAQPGDQVRAYRRSRLRSAGLFGSNPILDLDQSGDAASAAC
jgi:hypothetical protein